MLRKMLNESAATEDAVDLMNAVRRLYALAGLEDPLAWANRKALRTGDERAVGIGNHRGTGRTTFAVVKAVAMVEHWRFNGNLAIAIRCRAPKLYEGILNGRLQEIVDRLVERQAISKATGLVCLERIRFVSAGGAISPLELVLDDEAPVAPVDATIDVG